MRKLPSVCICGTGEWAYSIRSTTEQRSSNLILKAYSKALYASWFYYAPDRILLDCGEGASLYLRQEIFAVEKIFISHGHIDHIAGILTFLCLRQGTKGDNEKPLTIYYPDGDRSMTIMRETARKMLGNYLKFELNWEPVNPGDRIPLKKGRFMEVFQADHHVDNPLVFVVTEERKHLKPELRGTPGPELAKLSAEEKYAYANAKVLAYSGDSMPIDPDVYRKAGILIHECTFLNENDRKYRVHSSVQEVFDLARDAEVERLILAHISPRYFRRDIQRLLDKVETHDLNYECVIPERICQFD